MENQVENVYGAASQAYYDEYVAQNIFDHYDITPYITDVSLDGRAYEPITEKVSVPTNLHQYINGFCGINVEKISTILPRIEITFNEDDEIVIEGPPDEVGIAKRSLNSFSDFLKSKIVVEEIHVDPKLHRHIVEKKSSIISQIQTETSVAIRIPSPLKEGSAEALPSDVIRIEGFPEGVAAAKEKLSQAVHYLQYHLDKARRAFKTIRIDKLWHQKLTGKSSEILNRLHVKFSEVQLIIPGLSSSSCDITLVGPEQQIETCAKYIQEMTDAIAASKQIEEFHVQKIFHAHIVGRYASTLNKIRETSDAAIVVPDSTNDCEVITIAGERKNVELARLMITDVVKAHFFDVDLDGTAENSTTSDQDLFEQVPLVDVVVKVPLHLLQYVLGERGERIRTRAAQCGVKIKLPNPLSQGDHILLHGPESKCAELEDALLFLFQHLSARKEVRNRCSYRETLRLDPGFYPVLVGRRGLCITKFTKKHGVYIDIPNNKGNFAKEEIVISGDELKVKAAKQDLLDFKKLFESRVTEEVEIDPGVYGKLIGPGGKGVFDLQREFRVRVSFPQEKLSNKVKIFGQEECVEKAKRQLLHLADSHMRADAAKLQQHCRLISGFEDFVARDERQSPLPAPNPFNGASL